MIFNCCSSGFQIAKKMCISRDANFFYLIILFLANSLRDERFEFLAEFWIVAKQSLNSFASLSQFGFVVAEPATALLEDSVFNAKVDDFAYLADAFAKHDFEFGFAERRSNLVFDNFYTGEVSYNLIAILDGTGFADVETYR